MAVHERSVRDCAQRALYEGTKMTIDVLAKASGRSPQSLARQIKREGWVIVQAPTLGEGVSERLRAIAAMLLGKAEALSIAATREGGKIDKVEIDGLVAMIRSLEKIGEIMQPDAAAKEKQIKENEDLAAVLERINERIVDLATELAAHMVAQQPETAGGATRHT